ncbi:hypothetical protein BF49_2911 [Bradyrhizobium sp.]|nr:hypothetical protein BF49_2911 [Bradyrhizobium sp.]
MSPGPQGVPALHPQDSRVRMVNRIKPSSRPNPAAFPPPLWGRVRERGKPSKSCQSLPRGPERDGQNPRVAPLPDPPPQGGRERRQRCWRTQLPQPPVPLPGNLILPEIKFAQRTLKPVALHNVDILGRHGLGAGRAIIRFVFPVFAPVTRLAGGRA